MGKTWKEDKSGKWKKNKDFQKKQAKKHGGSKSYEPPRPYHPNDDIPNYN